MSNIEDILTNQEQLTEEIEKILRNFKKDGADRKTPLYIKKRLEVLDSYWDEFKVNHTLLYQEQDQNYEYFFNNQYQQTKELYHEARSLIANYVPEKKEEPPTKAPTVQLTGPQPSGTTSTSQTQLEEEKTTAYHINTKSQGNASKSEDLLRKQKSHFKALSRTLATINLEQINEKWEFEDVLKTLELRWKAIDSLHWEIDSEIPLDKEYEQVYEIYENQYTAKKKAINTKMWCTSHKEKSTPKMELPIFSGSYYHWTSFKDLFVEVIHENRTLSGAQKMQYLKSKVKGEAEKLIQHLPISSENYQICWDILNQRYNNKKQIFTSHLNNLLNLPVMQYQTATTIKKVHDTANECLNAIKKLNVDISTWDPILVHLLSQKLDTDTYNDYIETIKEPRQLPILAEFMTYLENKFTALESVRRKQERSTTDTQHQRGAHSNKLVIKSLPAHYNYNSKLKSYNNAFPSTMNKKHTYNIVKCPLCKNEHGLFHCNEFIKLQTTDRRHFVAKHNLCINCLFDHKGKACKSEKRCLQCNENHHTLLHESTIKPISRSYSEKTIALSTSRDGPATNVSMENISETLLATAQVKVKASDGSEVILRALIDQGSQISIITENAAQLLGLARRRYNGVIFGVGTQGANCKGTIVLTCSSVKENFTFDTQVFVMNKLVNNLPNRTFSKPSEWTYLEGIPLADPDFNKSRPIDILFGAGVYSNIVLGGIIKGSDTQPIAQQSKLGWILCGNMRSYQCNVVLNNLNDIKKFWEIEDIAECSQMSAEETYCLQQYQTETKRLENGRYVVRLPLHPDIEEKLGESRPKATAQFFQLEKRFETSKNMAKNYKAFMTEYKQLNHMKICQYNKKSSYYLPHHCVIRADSGTTPLRVIFNASAKTTSGLSLNDLMYSGPNLQADLLSLILKWRRYKIALTADIEKMFRQILCHEDDQRFQKILWRDSTKEQLQDHCLTTVIYGCKPSPFLAMMTLKRLANDERQTYPQAAAILDSSFYMDDLLYSVDSLQDALRIKSELTNLLKSGGFNLRKWSSNKIELLKDEMSICKKQEAYNLYHLESTKKLGIQWNPNEDNFTFQLPIDTTSTKPVTKRILLSEISKIFDPLGWLSPVTTKLKLIFQKVWQENIGWDDYVPESVNKDWEKIKGQLAEIQDIKVPRWLLLKQGDDIELHGYCDSSINCYACVIYILTKTGSVILVAGKARLVPAKKTTSLPRLELCAAVLLSTLMKKVKECLNTHHINAYGWSDSTAVLGWINGDHIRWNTFVSKRVQKIKEIIPACCWRYVKSSDNPADCASRGILPNQLKAHNLWWNGPQWLPTFKPTMGQTIYETNEEIKKLQTNVTIKRHDYDVILDLLSRNSNLIGVIRVIAWVLRALTRNHERPAYLTAPEIRKARNTIIKFVQKSSFELEISSLERNETLNRKSILLPLNPYLDAEGLLRVGGRINNANIDAEQKNPIIIPHNGQFTEMLIDYGHKITFHGGPRVTSARLRKQYWIIGGNRAVKKRIFYCVKCRRHNPIQQTQIMGDLPSPRCNPSRPFYHTGVDYTGHLDVKTNKGRGVNTTKGYVAVFVCMATKAIHLELVSDLTSSSFLAALRRLSARKGAPGHLYSDNATNFTKSRRILKQEFFDLQQILDPEFFSAIADMNIEWHMNAPSWPSAGGLWERAVRSLKFHLRRVVGEQKLTYEELSTLLAELEACLNSRPLLPLTEDPEDIDYLTPSHFLSSGPNLTIIETEKDERTRWQLVQKIFKDVWKRWQSEYLTQLSPRSKWLRKKPNMNINDLVVIHDSNLPAGKWALGRVVALHEGKDGYVRVVTVRTKNGIIKRPIIKLSRLPVTTNSDMSEQTNKEDEEPEEPSQNIRARPKRTLKTTCGLIWAFLSMLILASPARCDYSLTAINNSQHIYFDKVMDMHLVRDEWKLIVYYDMDPYWHGMHSLKTCISTLQQTCSNIEKNTLCNVILLQLRHGYTELIHYGDILLDQKPTKRQRRGIVNGIGYIANTLFGILDEHFAQQYEKDIEIIKNNENHLALLWRNQTSILEAENNVLKRVEQSMKEQYKMFTQHLDTLSKATNTLAKEINEITMSYDFIQMSLIANGIFINLKDLQETLLETITEIHYGKFNIHLLNPQQLTEELNIISGQLSKDLTLPIDNSHTDLRKIYQLLRVKARMTKKYFIFELKIPLITRDSYDIYNLIPVPQRTSNSKTMVKVLPMSDYVSVNLQKDAYIPMSENEIQTCTSYDQKTLMCLLQKPIFQLQPEDQFCKRNEEKEECTIEETICSDMWTQLNNINTYLYFCCELRTIRIICGYQVTAVRLIKAGIIHLSNGCVIKGDAFTIFSHSPQTNLLKIQPEEIGVKIPPINTIFNITLPKIVTSNTTDLQSAVETIDNDIEQMKREDYGLAHSLISTHDVHQYVVLYLLAGIALLGTGVYLWRRWRAHASVTLPTTTATSIEPATPLQVISPTTRIITQTSDVGNVRQQNRVDKATSPVGRRQLNT